MPFFPSTLGSCCPCREKQEAWILGAMEPTVALELRSTIADCSGALQTLTRQALPSLASPSCSGKICDLGVGGVSFHVVTLTSRPHIKAGFQHHHDIHELTLEPLALTYFHSLYCSIYRSSLLLTWGLTYFPVQILPQLSFLMIYIFSLATTFATLLTGVQILLWPDNPGYSG